MNSLRLYDAHNHLHFPVLAPVATEAARRVSGAVVNGTHTGDWAAVAALTQAHPTLTPSFGIHPWEADQAAPDWEPLLIAQLDAYPEAGVGEIGLDRWKTGRVSDTQIALFKRQLAIAAEGNRPVTIHCLRAWGRLEECLRTTRLPERGFLLHSYGGPPDRVQALANLGARFSFSGYFLSEAKRAKAETFRSVPPERLLIETDAPSMAPPPEWSLYPSSPDSATGEPVNHPGNLASIYRGLAQWLDEPLDALATRVESNFHAFFR